MTTAPTAQRLADALQVAADVAAVARSLGDEAGAAAISAEAARRATGGTSTVVVAGEKKRGKTSLVNALVDRPALLPVDADVATHVHAVLRFTDEPAVTVVDADHPDGFAVALDDVGGYAALDPETGKPTYADVTRVEIGLPAPLLADGLRLVDTPGVGGLFAGHAEVSLAALSRADALMFVVDGSSELTESELDFLHRATERIGLVHFVLTKTDAYPDWEQVLERDRELIRTRAPRFAGAPWFPVSSRQKSDADRALTAGRAERADRLRERSGLPALVERLRRDVTGPASTIRTTNVLHIARSVAARHRAAHQQLISALAGATGDSAPLAAEQERLRRLTDQDARWRAALAEDGKRLDRELRLACGRRIEQLRQRHAEQLARGGAADLTSLPDVLTRQLEALWLDQETMLRRGLDRIAARVTAEAGLEDAAEPTGAPGSAANPMGRLPSVARTGPELDGIGGSLDRILPSLGVGSLAATVTAAVSTGVFAPLTVGLGAVWLLAQRRKQREEVVRSRADGTRYVEQVLRSASLEIPGALTDALEQAVERTRTTIGAVIAERRTEVEAALRTAASAAHLAAAEAEQRRQSVRRHHDALDQLVRTVDALLLREQGAV